MRCFNPVKIRDPVTGVMKTVSCYYCEACIMRRKKGWFLRLRNEEKRSRSVWFITLTYSEEYVPWSVESMTLVKQDLIKFNKRLRKALHGSKSAGTYYKYYGVGEYGTIEKRPHYHLLLFLGPMTQKTISDLVEKAWKFGRSQVEPAGVGSFMYVSGYIMKSENHYDKIYNELRDNERAFAVMSKGIGEQYIKTHSEWHQDDITRGYAIIENGIKVALPRYYRDKIYSLSQKVEQTNLLQQKQIQELSYRDVTTIVESRRLQDDRRDAFSRLIQKSKKGKL